jgi:hypothetical protein
MCMVYLTTNYSYCIISSRVTPLGTPAWNMRSADSKPVRWEKKSSRDTKFVMLASFSLKVLPKISWTFVFQSMLKIKQETKLVNIKYYTGYWKLR